MRLPRSAGTLLSLLLALILPLAAGQEVIDEVVAVINGDIITLSEVKARNDLLVQALRAQLSGEEFDKQYELLKQNLLDRMITEVLLLQKAREMKLDVREQLRATIDNIKKQNNLDSDEDLRLALSREGLDYNTWLRQMEEDLMRQAVLFSEVDRQIVIDDAEVVKEYRARPELYTEPEEVSLRGIFLSEADHPAETLESQKNDIKAKLAAGEDFASVAGLYSDGPAKDVQGDLGSFKTKELDPVLEKAVAGLQPGQTSAWVKAKNGWYLLRLENRKASRLRPFEEAKKDMEERIFNQKRAQAIDEYMGKLKQKNYIKIVRPNPLGS
jgi:peptidyl-prolyl cis-trans isomerase SurA